jgi:nucleotide-binding universal stress UspA family protein
MMAEQSQNFATAINDFHRARTQANLEQMRSRLTGKSADLFSYEEVRQKLRETGRAAKGLQEIPLEAIVGSVGRYDDFTRSFLPRRDSDAQRWARVEAATLDLKGLPPIEVYQIGHAYFVLDGNHRVSVARQLGAPTIQAYVTEVRTKVPFSPDTQPDELILKAEYADFLDHTHLDKLRPEADLTVTEPGKYRILEEHIEVHRYFMGLEAQREITYEEAVAHWYDQVYLPVLEIIRDQGVLWNFPERTEADLYLWISRHRAGLEQSLGWKVASEAAAADLSTQFSPGLHHLVARLGKQILDTVIPDSLESGPLPGHWRRERLATHRDDRLFTDILVPVSGEARSWSALEQAAVIAHREDGRVLGLHVVSTAAKKESEATQQVRVEFEQRCEAAGVSGKLAVVVGDVARQICERTKWSDLVVADLAHPPGLQPLTKVGSRFRTLIRRCPRPVLAIVPGVFSELSQALLAYDGSPKAKEALFIATYLAGQWRIPLTVLTVLEGDSTKETAKYAQEYLASHGAQATFLTEHGPVGQVILEVAETNKIDLILMGSYGLNPVFEMVLGSAVDQVLRESCQPMLICR